MSIQIYISWKFKNMQEGDRIHLFRNTNLEGYDDKKRQFTLKDQSLGIVHQKLEGVVRRILKHGERLSISDIEFYCRNNSIMRKSFKAINTRNGVRAVVEIPDRVVGRYRMVHSLMWEKATPHSFMGYIRVVPNSVKFILDDI